MDSFTVFTILQETRPFGKNASMESSIFQNGLKGFFFVTRPFFRNFFNDRFFCQIERKDFFRNPFTMTVYDRLPNCRYFFINFHHNHMRHKPFKQGGKTDNSSTGKGFD